MKEFIPYEQSHDMKDLGFDEPCLDNYNMYGKLWGMRLDKQSPVSDTCLAPLYQQAFRWFRENHNLYHWIEPVISTDTITTDHCFFEISSKDGSITYLNTNHYNYPEAELACLKKLIEIVKNK